MTNLRMLLGYGEDPDNKRHAGVDRRRWRARREQRAHGLRARRAAGLLLAALVAMSIQPISKIAAAEVRSAEGTYSFCIECHGTGGVSINDQIPNLAGQKKLYLYKQLLEFRTASKGEKGSRRMGQRAHLFMNLVGEKFTKPELASLSFYLEELSCNSKPKATQGSVPATVAICKSCHHAESVAGADITPDIAGQKAAYLAKQLRAFRASARGKAGGIDDARSFHLMDKSANRLSNKDIAELSEYYASLACAE